MCFIYRVRHHETVLEWRKQSCIYMCCIYRVRHHETVLEWWKQSCIYMCCIYRVRHHETVLEWRKQSCIYMCFIYGVRHHETVLEWWKQSCMYTCCIYMGGGYGFLFRSQFFFRTTRELEYFFCRAKREIFPVFNIRLYDKTLNQIFFFLHQNQNIFWEKNHNPSSS
jgi:hypothetical protein